MPRIFDNIEQNLLPSLIDALKVANRADFCVGYFNLRGWKLLDKYVENWAGGDSQCCRLLVGMQKLPHEAFRDSLAIHNKEDLLDNSTLAKLKKLLAEQFREQLVLGVPSNSDETGLRRLVDQIKSKKVVVKLFLKHPLHAKLYLLFRPDPINPSVGFLGSSNLTQSGLSNQGELNVDVLEHDACDKLSNWFDDRWNDQYCIDISNELVQIIDESWARDKLIPPYQIYIKIAYHLSDEARSGLVEFEIPKDFENKLLDFQTAAVKIAAHHLNKRGGVIIGDVVGLGKTLMATALARIFEDDFGLETLIICPKNLVSMWKEYRDRYRLRARVLSISRVSKLSDIRRYRLVVIDESHNLRNTEGQRYRMIQSYISNNESRCILLSATPYNKTYLDLSSQLGLFVPMDEDLGIRPEKLLSEIGETEFIRHHQASVRSLKAFEKSEHPDDWRELMRLFLVRRTRSFIERNYTIFDQAKNRNYLEFANGQRSYFPLRTPKTVKFQINKQYSRLYSNDVVDEINKLILPRYGLANYVVETKGCQPTTEESQVLEDLSRAGKRLMGFCRINLLKRLESSGQVFFISLERHILKNYLFLYALENKLAVPIGEPDIGYFTAELSDEDSEIEVGNPFDGEDDEIGNTIQIEKLDRNNNAFRLKASKIYKQILDKHTSRVRWLESRYFSDELINDLRSDANSLLKLLTNFGHWDPTRDTKLDALSELINEQHPNEKILIFSQFADTVRYLEEQLATSFEAHSIASVTGNSTNPTELVRRFSPISNESKYLEMQDKSIRILIATDVLSEGQNLQDCSIVVNYDLPWAIIKLIQRAGRVDRIGQQALDILCYSFLPADGIEQHLKLRTRVQNRLEENAEVVGTDEKFFEDEGTRRVIDLYNEESGVLDDEEDGDVDLSSYAYQIWSNAVSKDPSLRKVVENLPPVVYSAKTYNSERNHPAGVLVFMQSSHGNNALIWMDENGKCVTESQFEILRAAECAFNEPALNRLDTHHDIVGRAAKHVSSEDKIIGGQLGRPSGARFKVYERLKGYASVSKNTLFDSTKLGKVIDDIYKYPLRQIATDTLNRQLRSGINDTSLVDLVFGLHDEGRLCVIDKEIEHKEPQIICSLGLIDSKLQKNECPR